MGSRTLRNPYRRLQRRLDALDRRHCVQQMRLDQLSRKLLMLKSNKALYEAAMNATRSYAIHKLNTQLAEAGMSAVNFSAGIPSAKQARRQFWRRVARAMKRPVPWWAGLVAMLALAALDYSHALR